MDKEGSVQRFLELIRRSHRGKFKVYIGMSAGVGKTYRMLQEAHQLLDAGVDVCIGYIETHGRAETEALAEGLPFVPRRRLFYKGKELEEMDTQAILNLHPEIVVVDELAHTNIEGSGNPKRWQDVMQLLDAGISVITAVNIQQPGVYFTAARGSPPASNPSRKPASRCGCASAVFSPNPFPDRRRSRFRPATGA